MKKVMFALIMLMVVVGMVMGMSMEVQALTDSSRSAPNIEVGEDQPVVLYSGTQNTLIYTMTNESVYRAKNLRVIPDMSLNGLDGVRLVNNTFTVSDTSLWADEPVTASLELVIDDTVDEGVYPINLRISYENSSKVYYEREILTYFEVRNDDSVKEKIIIGISNADELKAIKGQNLSFQYSINNGENYEAGNVKTYIVGLPEAYFAQVSTAPELLIGKLKRNVIKYVSLDYHVHEDTPNGSYPYEIILTYENEFGHKVVRSKPYNLFVNSEALNGEIKVTAMSYPSSAKQDQSFEVGFDISNSGDDAIEDMVITMSENPVFLPKSASIVKVETLELGASYHYEATVVAAGDDLVDRNYPLEFTITYNNGSEEIVDQQMIGVYVDANDEDETTEGNVPKIIISDYVSEPQIVKAGGDFDLTLDFTNTNRSKTIYNVKAYITANESTEDTGNVFTPVGSSNTFYIDEISPKAASRQSIRLFTVPDAAPKTYNLTINFEYEDKDGRAYTATEFVGIPVTQVSKVEASDFNVPSEVMMGEGVNVYFDLFNTGKAKVYNLLIKAEGNFTSDPVSRYIGNFDVGSSDYFDAYVNFNELGLMEGKFVISYDDATGEQFLIEKPFAVNVSEAMSFDEGDFMPDPYPYPEEGNKIGLPFIIGGLAGLIILIIIIVLRRRKKKRDQEMNFDEDI